MLKSQLLLLRKCFQKYSKNAIATFKSYIKKLLLKGFGQNTQYSDIIQLFISLISYFYTIRKSYGKICDIVFVDVCYFNILQCICITFCCFALIYYLFQGYFSPTPSGDVMVNFWTSFDMSIYVSLTFQEHLYHFQQLLCCIFINQYWFVTRIEQHCRVHIGNSNEIKLFNRVAAYLIA